MLIVPVAMGLPSPLFASSYVLYTDVLWSNPFTSEKPGALRLGICFFLSDSCTVVGLCDFYARPLLVMDSYLVYALEKDTVIRGKGDLQGLQTGFKHII